MKHFQVEGADEKFGTLVLEKHSTWFASKDDSLKIAKLLPHCEVSKVFDWAFFIACGVGFDSASKFVSLNSWFIHRFIISI